jgi:hypothetical protein
VRNLKHLANMVENCGDQFLRFDLEYQQVNFHVIFSLVTQRIQACALTDPVVLLELTCEVNSSICSLLTSEFYGAHAWV